MHDSLILNLFSTFLYFFFLSIFFLYFLSSAFSLKILGTKHSLNILQEEMILLVIVFMSAESEVSL